MQEPMTTTEFVTGLISFCLALAAYALPLGWIWPWADDCFDQQRRERMSVVTLYVLVGFAAALWLSRMIYLRLIAWSIWW